MTPVHAVSTVIAQLDADETTSIGVIIYSQAKTFCAKFWGNLLHHNQSISFFSINQTAEF